MAIGSCSTCCDTAEHQSLRDIRRRAEDREDSLETGRLQPTGLEAARGVEAGEGPAAARGEEISRIDTAALETRLAQRFGDEAAGIVGQDGRIDFERLQAVIAERREQDSAQAVRTSEAGVPQAGAEGGAPSATAPSGAGYGGHGGRPDPRQPLFDLRA